MLNCLVQKKLPKNASSIETQNGLLKNATKGFEGDKKKGKVVWYIQKVYQIYDKNNES